MKIANSFVFAVFFLTPSSCYLALAQDGTGLKSSMAVDIVGEFSADKDSDSADRVGPRSIDLMFVAPIDHLFDGVLSIAAHREKGASFVELHESFISSDKLISGMRFRLGQYFLNIGRLNRFHRHEWPFISTPIVQSKFFDDEGILDSGVEASYLLPLPFYIDLTAGVTNGFVYGHSHDEGDKPRSPLHYARLASFFSIQEFDVQPGLSYLSRVDSEETKTGLFGIDVTGKLKKGKTLKYLFQSEIWQRILKPKLAKEEISTGLYVFQQYGFSSGFSAGLRYDYLTVNTKKDAQGSKIKNSESAIAPSIGYRPSEFSSFGLGYRIETVNSSGEENRKNNVVEFQSTFILGAHPAHDF